MQAHPYLTSPGLLRPSCSRFHAHLLPLGTAPPLGILPCIDPPNDPSKRPQRPSYSHHCVSFGCRRSTRSYRRSSSAGLRVAELASNNNHLCHWLQEKYAELQAEFHRMLRIAELSRTVSKENLAKTSRTQKALRQVRPAPHTCLRHCDLDRGHKSLGFILKGRGGEEQSRAGQAHVRCQTCCCGPPFGRGLPAAKGWQPAWPALTATPRHAPRSTPLCLVKFTVPPCCAALRCRPRMSCTTRASRRRTCRPRARS